MIALTKTLAQEDYVEMDWMLRNYVDPHFGVASPQHEARRWEYAMGLEAALRWGVDLTLSENSRMVDVGGAGSPLATMLRSLFPQFSIAVVDPELGEDLGHFADRVGAGWVDAAFCISTIEHVEDMEDFIADLTHIVAPSGLLFLTMDIWDRRPEEPDTAHFHWMRKRIFTPESWLWLAAQFHQRGFDLCGDADWKYHGDQLYGSYSFASLALRKSSE